MIYTTPYFSERLKEERHRSDRTGKPFSLVLISMDKVAQLNGGGKPFLDALDKFLKTIRSSDVVGWFSHNELALLLPETKESEARKVLQRIEQLAGESHREEVRNVVQNGILSVMEYPKILQSYIQQGNPSLKIERICRMVTDIPSGTECSPGEREVLDLTSLCTNNGSRKGWARLDCFAKRSFDLIGSLVAIVLFFPIMFVIGVLVKLTSEGPVLFKQRRIGQYGKEFTFLKFRTMYHNCDQSLHKEYVEKFIENRGEKHKADNGEFFKIVNDPRVTPLGRFLRRSSLDELPQFFNVLKGEMSIVGPRPPIPYEVRKYKVWQLRRILEAKPGITGLWQVSGRSKTTFDEQVRLDLRYVSERSFWLDILICFKTLGVVFSKDGAF